MVGGAHPQSHPAPHRARAGAASLLFALAIGPAAWIAQMVVGSGVANYACDPDGQPLLRTPPPGWSGEPIGLLALNLTCLGVSAVGLAIAFAAWRRTKDEKSGGAARLLEVGEGRTRFLALCGVLSSAVFALAIAFNTAGILWVPACWAFRP